METPATSSMPREDEGLDLTLELLPGRPKAVAPTFGIHLALSGNRKHQEVRVGASRRAVGPPSWSSDPPHLVSQGAGARERTLPSGITGTSDPSSVSPSPSFHG